MVLIKSIFAGLLFLVVSAFLSLVGVVIAFAVFLEEEMEPIGIDPISVVRASPVLWVLAVLVFSLGFSWEYRRAKCRQAR